MQPVPSELRLHVERLDSLPRIGATFPEQGISLLGGAFAVEYPESKPTLLRQSSSMDIYAEPECVKFPCQDGSIMIMSRIITDINLDSSDQFIPNVIGSSWIQQLLLPTSQGVWSSVAMICAFIQLHQRLVHSSTKCLILMPSVVFCQDFEAMHCPLRRY